MDTSEAYIKMCDCPEIQGQWEKEQYGDILAVYDRKRTHENGSHYYTLLIAGGPPIRKSKNRIWLPRQDDIQKMMGKTELAFCIYQSTDNEDKWGGEIYWDRGQGLTIEMDSPEQLWLAFYMFEKCGKKWGSKEWA